jgi:hypothetical protein
MGLRPTQGDEKAPVQQRLSMEAPPSPLSSRPERSARDLRFGGSFLEMFFDREITGLRPTQGDEKRLLFSGDCRWKHRPPLLSSRPKRSAVERSLCGCSFLEMFSDRGITGLRPTQGDEKRLLFSGDCRWKHRPPLCHLDRSAAQWRDLCVDAPSWKCRQSIPEIPTPRRTRTHI